MDFEQYKKDINNKRVAIVGIGVSNIPLIKYLYRYGAKITACDKKDNTQLQNEIKLLEGLDIDYSLGSGYLDSLIGFDIIFKSPGIRYDLPQFTAAVQNGAVLTSEIEMFCEFCPSTIIGITGSDGKTTTTTLIYNILKEQGYNCWLGGNIGIPLFDKLDEMKKEDYVVLELSSFQLHTMNKSPKISVITNVSPNHLDMHKSYQEYIDAKKNIFLHQNTGDYIILNYDNEITKNMSTQANSQVRYFSLSNQISDGVVLENNIIKIKNNNDQIEVASRREIILPGLHNIDNILTAIVATYDLVDIASIRKVITTFKGVEHRIEFVRDLNGIKFYNDSIASSPSRTIAGLKSFEQQITLICGGYDKHIPYDEMGEYIYKKVKKLVVLGQTADAIITSYKNYCRKNGIEEKLEVNRCSNFEEAVIAAYNNATVGDIILLSPASASFDMFKNFEERGNRFKKIVNELV